MLFNPQQRNGCRHRITALWMTTSTKGVSDIKPKITGGPGGRIGKVDYAINDSIVWCPYRPAAAWTKKHRKTPTYPAADRCIPISGECRRFLAGTASWWYQRRPELDRRTVLSVRGSPSRIGASISAAPACRVPCVYYNKQVKTGAGFGQLEYSLTDVPVNHPPGCVIPTWRLISAPPEAAARSSGPGRLAVLPTATG